MKNKLKLNPKVKVRLYKDTDFNEIADNLYNFLENIDMKDFITGYEQIPGISSSTIFKIPFKKLRMLLIRYGLKVLLNKSDFIFLNDDKERNRIHGFSCWKIEGDICNNLLMFQPVEYTVVSSVVAAKKHLSSAFKYSRRAKLTGQINRKNAKGYIRYIKRHYNVKVFNESFIEVYK